MININGDNGLIILPRLPTRWQFSHSAINQLTHIMVQHIRILELLRNHKLNKINRVCGNGIHQNLESSLVINRSQSLLK